MDGMHRNKSSNGVEGMDSDRIGARMGEMEEDGPVAHGHAQDRARRAAASGSGGSDLGRSQCERESRSFGGGEIDAHYPRGRVSVASSAYGFDEERYELLKRARWRFLWECFLVLILTYVFGSSVIRLCYPEPANSDEVSSSSLPWIVAADIVVDGALLADVLLRMRSISFWRAGVLSFICVDSVEDGNTRRDGDVAMMKMRAYASGNIRCVADCLAWIPLDFIALAFGANPSLQTMAYYRVNRLLKLAFASRHTDVIGRYSIYVRKSSLWTNTNALRAAKLFLVMAALANVAGSLFYLMAYVETMRDPGRVTWASNDGLNVTQGGDLFTKYARSVYWAVITQVTTGFGDIVPASNIPETLYTVFAMYAGVVVTCSAVANLTNLIAGIDSRRLLYERNIMLVKRYIKLIDLPQDTASRVLHFFEYTHSHDMDDPATERMLITNLPRELTLRIRGMGAAGGSATFSSAEGYTVLRIVPEFQQLKSAEVCAKFLYDLATSLEKVVFIPGDEVVRENEELNAVRFLSRGKAWCLKASPQTGEPLIVKRLREGDYFGMRSLAEVTRSPFEVRAKTYCEYFVLSRSEFESSLKECLTAEESNVIKNAVRKREAKTSRTVPGQRFGRTVSSRVAGSALGFRTNLTPPRKRVATTDFSALGDIDAQFKASLPEEDGVDACCGSRQSFIFLPESSFRNIWMLCCFLGVLYNTFSLSFEMAFFYDEFLFTVGFAHAGTAVVISLNYIIDLFFLVDLVFTANCFAFVNTDGGDVVTDPKLIWARAKGSLFFYLDILSVIPTDLVSLAIGIEYLPLLRLNRLFRLCHLFEYFSAVESFFLYKKRWNLSLGVRRTAKTFLLLIVVVQWMGCMWYLLARMCKIEFETDANWVDTDAANSQMNFQEFVRPGGNATRVAKSFVGYLRSVYWVLVGASTIGYGDITATNIYETVFSTFVILFGGLLKPAIVGSMASLLLSAAYLKRDERASAVRAWSEFAGLPREFKKRLEMYHSFMTDHFKGVDESQILSSMPPGLRKECYMHVRKPMLDQWTHFPKDIYNNEAALLVLLKGMKHVVYIPEDKIEVLGQFPNAGMHYLIDGEIRFETNEGVLTHRVMRQSRRAAGIVPAKSQLSRLSSLSALGFAPRRGSVKSPRKESEMTSWFSELCLLNCCRADDAAYIHVQRILKTCGDGKALCDAISTGFAECYVLKEEAWRTVAEKYMGEEARVDVYLSIASSHSDWYHRVCDARSNWETMQRPSIEGEEQAAVAYQNFPMALRHRAESSNSLFSITSLSMRTFNLTRWLRQARHPEATSRFAWESLITFVLFFNGFVIPYRLAFNDKPNYLYIIAYMFDIAFVVDVFFNRRKFWFLEKGKLVKDPKQIADRYTNSGRFLFDVAASIPFDFIALVWLNKPGSPPPIWLALAVSRVPKLLRLNQLLPYCKRVERSLLKFWSPSKRGRISKIVRFGRLMLFVLLLTNWAACVFYTLARGENDFDYCEAFANDTAPVYKDMHPFAQCLWNGTWMQLQYEANLIRTPEIDSIHPWTNYVRSLNWALPTLVVVVIGDVIPINVAETAYVVVLMLSALIVNAAIIGSMSDIIADVNSPSGRHRKKETSVFSWMEHHGVPRDLRTRVHAYFRSTWMLTAGVKTENAQSFLPPALLRMSKTYFIGKDLSNLSRLFGGSEPAVFNAIIQSLQARYLIAREHLLYASEPARTVYFISSGRILLLDDKGDEEGTVVAAGGFVGSKAILEESEAQMPESTYGTSAIAIEDVRCWSLARSVLRDNLFCYPAQHRAVVRNFLSKGKTAGHDHNSIDRRRSLSDDGFLSPLELEMTGEPEKLKRRWREPTLRWHGFVVILYAYIAFMIPARAMFMVNADSKSAGQLALWFISDYVVMVLFLVDARASGLSAQNGWSEAPWASNFNILRKSLACIILFTIYSPLMDIIFCSIHGVSALQFTRLTSMGMLWSVPVRINTIFYSPAFSSRVGSSLFLSRPFVVVFTVLTLYVVLNHWYACIWMLLHRVLERDEATTWALVDGLASYNATLGEHNICDVPIRCYVRAVYFTITTLSTVGYGDIRPYTNLETVFQIFVAMTGATLFASLIGAIACLLDFKDSHGSKFVRGSLGRIRHFLHSRNVKKDAAERIERHMLLAWSQCGNSVADENVLGALSRGLRSELAMYAKQSLFKLNGILNSLPPHITMFIAPCLQAKVYQMSQQIFASGSVFGGIYFIESGKVALTHPSDTTETADDDSEMGCDLRGNASFCGAGDCFGGHGLPRALSKCGGKIEISLAQLHHRHHIHVADAQALSSCLVYFLSANDLEAALNYFPQNSRELDSFLACIVSGPEQQLAEA